MEEERKKLNKILDYLVDRVANNEEETEKCFPDCDCGRCVCEDFDQIVFAREELRDISDLMASLFIILNDDKYKEYKGKPHLGLIVQVMRRINELLKTLGEYEDE